jgi:hypothetical protein
MPTLTLDGNTAVFTFSMTRDGQPYCEGEINYHAMGQAMFDEMKADTIKVLSKEKLTGIDYKGLRKVEKALGKMVDDWAEKHENQGKGK